MSELKRQAKTDSVQWLHVATFYVLACAISWPFFWWRDMESQSFREWGVPGILKTASIMWGPGLAAIICLVLFRKSHKRTITLLGTSPWRSLVLWVSPWFLLGILGGPGQDGISGHLFGFLLPVVALFSVLGEEVGWRGFLQDALRPLRPIYRYLLIGYLWEIWHFTNRTRGKTVIAVIFTVLIAGLIASLLSWLIGRATDRTRAILVAALMHGLVNATFEFAYWQAYIAIGFALALLALFLWRWPQPVQDSQTVSSR